MGWHIAALLRTPHCICVFYTAASGGTDVPYRRGSATSTTALAVSAKALARNTAASGRARRCVFGQEDGNRRNPGGSRTAPALSSRRQGVGCNTMNSITLGRTSLHTPLRVATVVEGVRTCKGLTHTLMTITGYGGDSPHNTRKHVGSAGDVAWTSPPCFSSNKSLPDDESS